MIKVLITGARSFENPLPIQKVIDKLVEKHKASNLLVIQGGAPGADLVAKAVCMTRGVHCAEIRAIWDYYDRGAGPIRNKVMLSLKPQLVVAFHWNLEESTGTANCVRQARELGIHCKIVLVTMQEAMPSAVAMEELKANKRRERKKKK